MKKEEIKKVNNMLSESIDNSFMATIRIEKSSDLINNYNLVNNLNDLKESLYQSKLLVEKLLEPNNNKEGKLKALWNKTIFPDMIEARKVRREENRKINAEKEMIRNQARKEAMLNMKDILVEKYKQEEIDKLTGKSKKDKMDKFANAFSMGGQQGSKEDKMQKFANAFNMGGAGGSTNMQDKINMFTGNTQSNNQQQNNLQQNNQQSNQQQSNNMINKVNQNVLGNHFQSKKSYEDKINQMLGK